MKWMFAIIAVAPFAAAAGTFTPPKGCSAFLTVQMKNCQVEHYWTCENDPEGVRWVLTIDSAGPSYLQKFDNEFRWLHSYPQRSSISRVLIEPEPDPNSLSGLLATGRDDFDFRQDVLSGGAPVAVEHITGFDKLTGTTTRIDGEPLLVTEFEFRITSDAGGETVRTYGNQYVSERFRLFFSGRETEEIGAESNFFDDSPVLFSEPGESGFLADKPEFGCDEMMSGLQMPLVPEKEKQDEL